MNNKSISATIAILGIVGAGVVGVSTKSPKKAPIVTGVAVEETPADKGVKFAKGLNGKAIRIVGAHYNSNAATVESEVGVGVEIPVVRDTDLCNVVMEARMKVFPVKKGRLDENPGFPVPDIDVLYASGMMFEVANPILLMNSESNGKLFWNIVLKGFACKLAVDLPGYMGSTLKEFLALPQGQQKRFLLVDGTCKFRGKNMPCQVPLGSKEANPGSKPIFPYGFYGRSELDF